MPKKKRVVRISVSNKRILVILLIVLAGLYTFNAYVTMGVNSSISKKLVEQKELARPANLDMTMIIDSRCTKCYNMSNVVSFLKMSNSTITNERVLEYTSSLAKKLMDNNHISSVPAVIIVGEVKKSNIASVWQVLGAKVTDDTAVVQGFPPYRNLSSDKVVGLVELVILNDSSCATCYDASLHKLVLPRFGVTVDKESVVDISSAEGKAYIEKYNITKVPTIILSSDASVYNSLVLIWQQVGNKEKDGWYVFRATEQMGDYKDLTSGQIVSQQGQ